MDGFSTLMIPMDVPSQHGKLKALESTGDGNCLFNAVLRHRFSHVLHLIGINLFVNSSQQITCLYMTLNASSS